MSTKSLTIREEAYRRLKAFKKKDQSFSDVIIDLTERKNSFEEGFGAWKGDVDDLRDTVKETREKLDEDIRNR